MLFALNRSRFSWAVLLAGTSLLAGCAATVPSAERRARETNAAIGQRLGVGEQKAALPELHAGSPPSDYLRFALLKHPAVAAAFHEWSATIEEITPARSLPDPRLTFEADITDVLMTFMPGVMFDFMAPGKRAAMGREAAAGSELAYRAYTTVVLRTAADVRRAWIELAYVDELARLRDANLAAIEQALAVSSSEYVTTRGMANFESQLRALNSAAQIRSEIMALEDRRTAARARFKSALGLLPEDTDPPWPHFELGSTALPPEAELWKRAQAANSELASMRAMVEMTVAGVDVARKAGRPDFALGAMADLKASPLMVRPSASVSLPIWRKKIAASIAAAEARRDGARARLSAERLSVAAELAQMLYMVREAERMLDYIDTTALPNLDRALTSAGAFYQSGMGGPAMIPELRVMTLEIQMERLSALRQRELAVTDLMLMVADVIPDGGLLRNDEPLFDDAR